MLKNEKKLGAASYKAPGISVIPVSSAEVLCGSVGESSIADWNPESEDDALSF